MGREIPDDVAIFMEVEGLEEEGPFIAVNMPAVNAESERRAEEISADLTEAMLSRNPLKRRRKGPDLEQLTEEVFNNFDH